MRNQFLSCPVSSFSMFSLGSLQGKGSLDVTISVKDEI